jgi:serine protease Do
MSIYDLPKFNPPKFLKNKKIEVATSTILVASIFGLLAGAISGGFFYFQIKDSLNAFEAGVSGNKITVEKDYLLQAAQEEAVVKAVEDIYPAVVSIIVTKDVPIIERYYEPFEGFDWFFAPQLEIPQYREKGTEKQEVGGGTGFIVSEEGLVLTNKHVVSDEEAEYTVFANDGEKYSAKVLAKNPFYDIAILKIDNQKGNDFPIVEFGDSENLKPGQTVIAIGNALGEFKNTVSVGVVSALNRTITASSNGVLETLEDVIQTDAAINQGNSGGPLLNLRGEVIGVNTAMVLEAQNIGFAIPIKQAEKSIEQVKEIGKIVYPFLGVRYMSVNECLQEKMELPVDYGALLVKGRLEEEPAVEPGSQAQKAGLMEGDIILEFNQEKITEDNSLAEMVSDGNPGDKVTLKVLRDGQEITIEAVLGERS